MPANQTYYAYNPKKPLSPEEEQVRAKGYKYVSTTVLPAYGTLGEHEHQSDNTHLIVSGNMIVAKSRGGFARFRQEVHGEGSEVKLPKKIEYIGIAGEKGCTFVEGHMALSPRTADRFFQRGTIVKATKDTKDAFAVTEGH